MVKFLIANNNRFVRYQKENTNLGWERQVSGKIRIEVLSAQIWETTRFCLVKTIRWLLFRDQIKQTIDYMFWPTLLVEEERLNYSGHGEDKRNCCSRLPLVFSFRSNISCHIIKDNFLNCRYIYFLKNKSKLEKRKIMSWLMLASGTTR